MSFVPYFWNREKHLAHSTQALHQNDLPEIPDLIPIDGLMLPRDDGLRSDYYHRRASGLSVCTICGCKYRDHLYHFDRDYREEYTPDTRLCNGDIVHL